jgi:transposase
MAGMVSYTKAAMERAMKVQEVMLRAMAKKITWYRAAEILGISDRHMRRWRERCEEFGYDGLFDRRRGKPSPKRVPLALVEQVLGLYRDSFCDPAAQRWAFEATVYRSTTCKGFVGFGDADPSNVSGRVRGAEMRVAETRAVLRIA